MRLLKPEWMHHDGNPIFSIDIHPDDSRVVTGGQGNDSVGRVVIWNMQALTTESEDLSVPKLLCQLDHHTACVNCVRWSNSGKHLCSGGDDRIIIVWKLISKYSGNGGTPSSVVNSAFGKTNLEVWKSCGMLRGHTGDVLDIAWSPGDKYLASASVDNSVIVWDTSNLTQIVTTIKGHNSMVKGVTWDPVGKYLASQSDDKTLRIWRVPTWELEHCVQDPFLECGGTTHVLRLDWSPDGNYLVSAHAMNGGGPTAQIIERDEWDTDKDFVGHRKAIVCVKFNQNIMQSGISRTKHCIVSIGSRDKSVSIWSTALKRPLVVIKDLFANSVLDMSWSSCGRIMMACSWDGTVAVSRFSNEEIGKPLSLEEKTNFYHKLYGKTVDVDENYDIVQNLDVYIAKQNASRSTPNNNNIRANTSPSSTETVKNRGIDLHPPPPKGPTDKQIETRTPDGRRRITPKFLLPPSEQEAPPESEQTVFMQGKGKEDGINNSQKSVQDLRKSMVSSIENVKGFSDTTAINNNGEGKEPQADDGETSKISSISSAEGNTEANNNSTEIMEVEECSDEQNDKGKSLVNGNGHSHVAADNNSGEIKKTDESNKASNDNSPKETRVNGELPSTTTHSSLPLKKYGTSKASKDGTSKSKNGVFVNGTTTEKLIINDKDKQAATSSQKLESVSSSAVTAITNKKDIQHGDNQKTSGVNLIAFRKKNKNMPEETSKTKKIKLTTPATVSTETSDPKPTTSSVTHQAITANSSLVLPPQRSVSNTSPYKPESSKTHHRLPPLKIQSVFNLQINAKADCSYSVQVTNYNKRVDGLCHQLVCVHSSNSVNGLTWTLCTDAPICGVSGDVHRIVVLCENSTLHVLDIKGRYAFPPLVLSAYPSKFLQSGAFLAVVTTKAIIHVWNLYTKKTVLKSESLLPLLHQNESEKERSMDIARIQLAAGGLPTIVLNTGKSFMYNNDFTCWMLLSDPRGLVSSPLTMSASEQPLSNRLMLFERDGRLRTKPEPAIISHIRLKLSVSTEMKQPDGVRQWLIALAKTLASQGLEKELRQLCEDLLGPTHSSAIMNSNWAPYVIGVVSKRQVLRQILSMLLEDLKYQDFYSEFDELLKEVEEREITETTIASASAPTT